MSDYASDGNEGMVVLDGNLHTSDGNEDTWPEIGGEMDYRQIDDSRWRSDLAQRWVTETGALEQGVSYTIDSLPEGYCVFDRDRASHSGRDPFLFGHPSGRYFQSRVTFFPHFYWLVTGRNEPCKCHICRNSAPTMAPDGTKKRRKRRTKAEMEAARAMEAGENTDGEMNLEVRPKRTDTQTLTPDANEDYKPQNAEGPEYWKMHIMKMKEMGDCDEPVDHPVNMDWVLTHENLDKHFTKLKLQQAFIPRQGELVLWAPKIDGPLVYNPDKCSFMIKKGNTWVFPEWRAGVITKPPKTDQSFLDIIQYSIEETDDEDSPDPRAFRVETIPDPLAPSKNPIVESEFVLLQCIKPFNTYARYVYGIPQEDLHPSISFAMTTMASYSLVSNVRFAGTWPNARIHSQGMFVGNELIALHDTIRLKPYGLTLDALEQGTHGFPDDYDPVDVMVIEDIWLELKNCNDDPKDPQIAQFIMPRLAGKVYTRQPRRLDYPIPFSTEPLVKLSNDEVSSAFHQIGMSGYGDWYSVAGGKSCVISPAMTLGRCYEPEAATLAFGTRKLDYDIHGVLNGRHYSCLVDSRTTKQGDWFWGDCRAETLGLATINGADVGLGAPQRQPPKRWHAIFRIVNGEAYGDTEIRDAGLNRGAGRPPKELEQYMSSSLVASGVGPSASTTPDDVAQESEEVDSEAGLTQSELAADIPYSKESAEEEYSGEADYYEDSVNGDF